MPRDLLKEYDEAYRAGRAELIATHYEEIVGAVHRFFQERVIGSIAPSLYVKEIVKFDYMTNLKANGDKHLWIDFTDMHDQKHHFEAIRLSSMEEYCVLDDALHAYTSAFTKADIHELADRCLGIFRRGYDKP